MNDANLFLSRLQACKRAAIAAQNPEWKAFWSNNIQRMIDAERKRINEAREVKYNDSV